MSEFKVGDRVFHKVNNLYGVITGERKEGADGNFYFSVKFDNDYEWFVQEKSIISIKDAPKNPYQIKIEQLEQRIEKLEKEVFKPVEIHDRPKETKPSLLTEDERVILRNLDKKWKWIARDSDGQLWIFTEKPHKQHDTYWSDKISYMDLCLFNQLFNFIRFGNDEPYNIEELLKGEIENEKGI